MLAYIVCVIILYIIVQWEAYIRGGMPKLLDDFNQALVSTGYGNGLSDTEFKIVLSILLIFAPIGILVVFVSKLWKVYK